MAKKKIDLASAAQKATEHMFSGNEKPKQEETKNTAPAIPEATEQANTTLQHLDRHRNRYINNRASVRRTRYSVHG